MKNRIKSMMPNGITGQETVKHCDSTEIWYKHGVRIVLRFFNETDVSAENYIQKQPTFMGYIR
jgi:hypothetical protein